MNYIEATIRRLPPIRLKRRWSSEPNVWWGWAALAQLRNDDLRANRPEQALERYEREFPALADTEELRVNRTNFRVAIDYSLVLARSGNQQRANDLLDRCMKFINTIPRMGQEGYWIADAAIYALRGDTQCSTDRNP